MNEITPPSKELLNKFLADENKIVIVFLIYMFGSLNLKMMAKLLDKSEPPVLRWIRKMLDENLILIDEEATKKSRGKFYKLSEMTEEFFDIGTFPAPNKKYIDKESKQQAVDQAINLMRSLGTLMNMLLKATANLLGDKVLSEEMQKEVEEGEFIVISSFTMAHFQTPADVLKFRQIVDEFHDKVNEEFDLESIKEPTDYSHSLSLTVTPINKIRKALDDMRKDWPKDLPKDE